LKRSRITSTNKAKGIPGSRKSPKQYETGIYPAILYKNEENISCAEEDK
jgi:hypothetical protein